MPNILRRSVGIPIREELTRVERWDGPDRGLIWCWERGRQIRVEDPELAARTVDGELPDSLNWKRRSLQYLAQWQGLRGEDLEIWLDGEREIACVKTGKRYVFKPGLIKEPDA
jgi:hypothetical protein